MRGEGLTITRVANFPVPSSEVGHPGLTKQYIVYPFADDGGTLPNAVG